MSFLFLSSFSNTREENSIVCVCIYYFPMKYLPGQISIGRLDIIVLFYYLACSSDLLLTSWNMCKGTTIRSYIPSHLDDV